MIQPPLSPPPGYGGPAGAPSGYGHPGHPAPPLPPVAPGGQPLAGFGDRLLAYVIDYAILAVVALVLMAPFTIYAFTLMSRRITDLAGKYPDPEAPPPPAEVFAVFAALIPIYLLLIVAVMVANYLYRVELMFRTGQTVGKRVMKLRVLPLHPSAAPDPTDPTRLTRGMAVRRWLIEGLAAQFVPFLGLIDGLWQLWDQPYRQCLHDKVAGTVVIKVAPWQ